MSELPPDPPNFDPPPPPPPPPGGYGAAATAGSGNAGWTGPPLADWGKRALAALIDWGIAVGAYIVIFIVGLIAHAIASGLGTLVFLVGYLAMTFYGFWLGYLNGQPGQTIGKRTVGIKVVSVRDGNPIGGGLGIVRAIAHVVDSLICFIGYLFPLWDPKRQTLADKIMSTVVIEVPSQPFSITPPT